ncbi:MAG: Asp-tRNA(Asn)/Glu-tRNA(Gln) amidotransferase subunit GatC [Actinomycetes bacterium]
MIDRSDVLHIARLARLELDESEVDRIGSEISGILAHVERISELDLEGVEPTAHSVAQAGELREDDPGESLPRERALESAPDTDGIGFRVPPPSA